MFDRLKQIESSRPIEARPGWLARRRATRPPAETVLNELPVGPALDGRRSGSRDAALGTRDSGLGTRDSGLATRDSGTRDSAFATAEARRGIA
jgi:hypothetical protein